VEKIKLEKAEWFCLKVILNVLYCADAWVLSWCLLQGQCDLDFE